MHGRANQQQLLGDVVVARQHHRPQNGVERMRVDKTGIVRDGHACQLDLPAKRVRKQGGKQSVASLEGSPPDESSGNGLAIISNRVVMVMALDGEPWGSHSVVKLQVRSKVRRGGLHATVARSLEVNYIAINRH